MSIQQLIDNALLKEQEIKLKRVRSGKFSPSMFGRCYRAQFWNRLNEPQTNPPNAEALRRFKVGNIIHDYVQQFFPSATEIKIEVADDIIGFADIVLPDEVVDIKSCRSYEFKLMLKEDYDIKTAKFNNGLQVCSYAYFLGKPKARLIFIEKDELDSKEFPLVVADWKQAIDDELEILRGHWKKQELPKPLPRAYGGKECQYCNWLDKCKPKEADDDYLTNKKN
jgi:hypothetical protein